MRLLGQLLVGTPVSTRGPRTAAAGKMGAALTMDRSGFSCDHPFQQTLLVGQTAILAVT
jgi:hypothetical protein